MFKYLSTLLSYKAINTQIFTNNTQHTANITITTNTKKNNIYTCSVPSGKQFVLPIIRTDFGSVTATAFVRYSSGNELEFNFGVTGTDCTDYCGLYDEYVLYNNKMRGYVVKTYNIDDTEQQCNKIDQDNVTHQHNKINQDNVDDKKSEERSETHQHNKINQDNVDDVDDKKSEEYVQCTQQHDTINQGDANSEERDNNEKNDANSEERDNNEKNDANSEECDNNEENDASDDASEEYNKFVNGLFYADSDEEKEAMRQLYADSY
jgi:hypothetical protein